MAEIVLWAVSTNSDLTEGRGRQYIAHFCRTEATARRLAKRNYVQGTDCPVEPIKVLELDGRHVLPMSLLKIEDPSKEDLIAGEKIDAHRAAVARAKELGLSDDEIKALRKGGDA